MDKDRLVAAIAAAIAGGAVAAPVVHPLGADDNAVRAQTDVGIEPEVFQTFAAALKQDPEFALFDQRFANVPHGGGVNTTADAMARLLLARAIATNDIPGTVDRFITYVATNAAPALAVAGVSGVRVEAPVQLGPDVQLVPMTAVPPSPQRGIALGQSHMGGGMIRGPIRSALVTQFTYQPVFYVPENPQPPEKMAAKIPTGKAQDLLEEAALLLGLTGTPSVYRMFWVQPEDWLMSAGIISGWQYSGSDPAIGEQAVPKEIEAVAAAYFVLPIADRARYLRIPLDRLNRALLDRDFADKAIDLGIALEALLLHESGDPRERGELKYRLGLRAAWLLGEDPAERQKVQTTLGKLYDLRSRAVHSGEIDRSAKTGSLIQHASQLCAHLIGRMIELKCRVDWKSLVAGGPPKLPE